MAVKIERILALLDELLRDINITDQDFKRLLNKLKSPDDNLKKILMDIGVTEEEIRKIMKVTDTDLKHLENFFK